MGIMVFFLNLYIYVYILFFCKNVRNAGLMRVQSVFSVSLNVIFLQKNVRMACKTNSKAILHSYLFLC